MMPGRLRAKWSPDGTMIAAAQRTRGVVVWDATTGALLYADNPTRPPLCLRRALHSRRGTAPHHVERPKPPRHLHPHLGGIRHRQRQYAVGMVGFSADGDVLVARS